MKNFKLTMVLIFVLSTLLLVSCGNAPEESNPFVIGQTVYPADNFSLTGSTKEVVALADQGAQIVNMTRDLIRVQFADGSEAVYNWKWFDAGEPFELTDEWVFGNPFVVGETVCAVPRSVDRNFSDKGVVSEVHDELIKLEGEDSLIYFGHFQRCP